MEIEILRILKFPSTDAKRIGQTDTVIFYRIDGKSNDVTTLTKDTSDEREIVSAIKADQDVKSKVVGKKFTI